MTQSTTKAEGINSYHEGSGKNDFDLQLHAPILHNLKLILFMPHRETIATAAKGQLHFN